MADASVTRRELSLGTRDLYHGWCGKSFAETTIDAIIYHNGNGPAGLPIGMYAKYPHSAFIPDVIHLGDEIKDANNNYYLVKAVEEMWWLDQFDGYLCNLELIENHYDRPTTSGTWHLDSESLKTDNRYRQKLFLDTYLTAGNIKEDNGSTNAYGVVMFAGADYPLKLEFNVTNTLDYIIAVEKGNVTPLYDAYHYPYCTEETTYAINKTGITAVNLLDQVYEEIKHAYTDHPVGSLRGITRSQTKREDIGGGCFMFTEEITIRYKRVNDDYTPTTPAVTWGPSASATGTFTFPNVTYISPPVKVNNTRLHPPGSIGSALQKLGMPDFMITIRCDLDIEPVLKTWKRPQTTTPKTDVLNWQVFLDIAFNGQYSSAQTYQTLNLGWGGTLKVTLEEVTPIQTVDSNELELVFAVYNSASATVYTTMFGIST